MKTKDKTTPGGLNGTPKKLKALPDKTGTKKITELPSDIGIHEQIMRLPLDQIELSPSNKRGSLKQEAIEEMAASIKKHDVLQAIVVRMLPNGRYQLVFGERRFRGSKLAGLVDIPAVIRAYTDEQVIEVQFAENFEREDPHFMDVVGQIKEWMAFRTPEEIAAQMGRPVRYVKDRVALQTLVADVEALARADKFTFSACLTIAALAPDSQQDFYDLYCKGQKDEEHFYVDNLEEVLESYKRRLARASFDITDPLLLPARGACTTCPQNTACVSLWPAEEKDALCTDRKCYIQKVDVNNWNYFRKMIVEGNATAYLQFGEELDDRDKKAMENFPNGVALKVVGDWEVTIVDLPEMPDRMDYVIEEDTDWGSDQQDSSEEGEMDAAEGDEDPEYGDDDDDLEEDNFAEKAKKDRLPIATAKAKARDSDDPQAPSSEPEIDELEFAEAMEEYQIELDAYNEEVKGHQVQTAISFDGIGKPCLYTFIEVPPAKRTDSSGHSKKYTSKEVMAALHAGTATTDMIEGEKKRIEAWIATQEHKDSILMQEAIHTQFGAFIEADPVSRPLSALDEAAGYWYIYHSLEYHHHEDLDKLLFPGKNFETDDPTLADFAELTAEAKALLTHLAVHKLDHADAPDTQSGKVLVELAGQYLNIAEIKAPQNAIAEARRIKKMPVIASLSAKLSDLDPNRPKDIPEWALSLAVEDCHTLQEFVEKYRSSDPALPPNEGALERAVYDAGAELAKLGYVTIYSKDSVTKKMVTFIPNRAVQVASESILLPTPDPAA